MSRGRIALIAAGLLITAGAFFLIVRAFGGAAATPETPSAEAADAGKAEGQGEDKEPPRWQSFIRPGEREAPPRPVLRIAQGLPSPFERFPGGRAGTGAGTGVRQESPGFRLEGISVGAQAVALLSGRAVRVGDTLSGYRVVRIGRSGVTLAGPRGARFDLALQGDGPASGGGR